MQPESNSSSAACFRPGDLIGAANLIAADRRLGRRVSERASERERGGQSAATKPCRRQLNTHTPLGCQSALEQADPFALLSARLQLPPLARPERPAPAAGQRRRRQSINLVPLSARGGRLGRRAGRAAGLRARCPAPIEPCVALRGRHTSWARARPQWSSWSGGSTLAHFSTQLPSFPKNKLRAAPNGPT